MTMTYIVHGGIAREAYASSWHHDVGNHMSCGHACPSAGLDLRPTLGFWEEMVAQYGDPFTLDERITDEDETIPTEQDLMALTRAQLRDYIQTHRNASGALKFGPNTSKVKLVQIALDLDEE